MVIWTKLARADLKHIHDFIAEDSKHYAKESGSGYSREDRHPEPASQRGQDGARSRQTGDSGTAHLFLPDYVRS